MTETPKLAWTGDLLGFSEIGKTFTALVQSIDGTEKGSKVISIEAGFGHGKTFFRKRWAAALKEAGEVVVEIDARQSDHSGDPVVTFIGALVGALGKPDGSRAKKFWGETKKWGGVAARGVGGAVMGKAVDGVIEAADGILTDDETSDLLDDLVEGAGAGLSKAAKKMIGTQLAAEKARQEMPAQLQGLLTALTEGKLSKRVVILIDELDRCHPDYAIQLLESMKLAFDEAGFVFVLMVNAEHLERIAAHRFVGWHKDDDDPAREPYLDKFVDMRLKLPVPDDKMGEAARALAMGLPEPEVPFGEGPEFTIERAAQVAADLAGPSGLSMRQIKRVLLRVDLAVRAYQGVPVDVPLLVALAFRETARPMGSKIFTALSRIQLTPTKNDQWKKHSDREIDHNKRRRVIEKNTHEKEMFVREACSELVVPARIKNRLGDARPGRQFADYHLVLAGLAPWYIPEHQAMLDHVHSFVAD